MGFDIQRLQNNNDNIVMPEKKSEWKYQPLQNNNKLPKFYRKKVTKNDSTYHFDFLDMEYDEEYNEFMVKGEEIELKQKSFEFKNKNARTTFKKLNNTRHSETEIIKKLRLYFKEIKKINRSTTENIKWLIEDKKIARRADQLIYSVAELLNEAGLKKTRNRYVMPQANNICRRISDDELLDFIYNTCDLKLFSTDTLDGALTYINKKHTPSYHKIATKNGYYDFEKQKFYTEAKEELIISKYSPFNYKEELIGTEPPKILKDFLETTFQDDLKKIDQLLEIIGYFLDDGNRFQLLISFIGPSRCGKGVVVKLMVALLGDNASRVDVMTADFNSKFVQELGSSDINIIEEVTEMKNLPQVKDYTGQGGLQIAIIYKGPELYKDIELPKTIVTTNSFNKLNEVIDLALIERMRCFIEFVNRVDDNTKRDDRLAEKIIANEDAMDWLLTNSIYKYSEVIKNGKRLSAEKSVEDFTQMLDQYSNPLKYALKHNFTYDLKTWEEYVEDHSKWKYLVTKRDIKKCLVKEDPKQSFSSHSKVKDIIMDAFALTDNPEDSYGEEGGEYVGLYDFETLYDRENDKQIKFLKGILKGE